MELVDDKSKLRCFTIPLVFNIYQSSEELIEKALKAGADPNQRDPFGRTPFHHAINCAQIEADASFEVERLMIKYQGDVNIRDAQHRSVLHYSFLKIENTKSRNCQNIPVMDIYTEKFDPLETISSLCTAISDCDVNIQDNELRTPLHYAAICGAVVSSKYLIKKGAKLEVQDIDHNTPLALAFLYRSQDMAILLLEAGANIKIAVNMRQSDSGKPGSQSEHKLESHSLFKVGIQNGWQGILYLLIDYGYSLLLGVQDAISEKAFNLARTLLYKNPKSELLLQTNEQKQTIMHIFALNAHEAEQNIVEKIMEDLLSRGLTLTAADKDGRTPLHYAFMTNFVYFINKALELQAASASQMLNQRDEHGASPVLYGAKNKMSEDFLTKLMEKYDVDVTVQDNEGTNLLFHCVAHHYQRTVRRLIIQGVDVNARDAVGRNPIYWALTNFRSIKSATELANQDALDNMRSDYEIITMLFGKNCDCNCSNEENESALHVFVKKCAEIHARANDDAVVLNLCA